MWNLSSIFVSHADPFNSVLHVHKARHVRGAMSSRVSAVSAGFLASTIHSNHFVAF